MKNHLSSRDVTVEKHNNINSHPIGVVKPGGEPKLTIRIIGRCNFRCPACSTFSSPERKGIMRLLDFKRAVDILASERFLGVVNISGGEPTLHPELVEMLSYISERLPENRVVLFTNGHWVGHPHWRQTLRHLLVETTVLVRFSLDRQHADGAVLAEMGSFDKNRFKAIEQERFEKARLFLNACLSEGALPAYRFDFAFKGSEEEAGNYMSVLGEVPLYLIRFRKDPLHRPKELGYFALDLNENNQVLVYPTLGHLSAGESLGGIDTLPAALKMNRIALKTKGHIY